MGGVRANHETDSKVPEIVHHVPKLALEGVDPTVGAAFTEGQ